MRYRPDIDGLRAIAIILVLIYHGGLSYFPSGFIGVDVFFVISGFLITSIIHESLNKKQFSFRYTSITLTAYLVFIYRMAMLSDFALSNVWFASLVSQKTADNGCVSAYFNLFFIDLTQYLRQFIISPHTYYSFKFALYYGL
jgi:peptidoglycan/LPS O-acetylase OafA/YrhL